MIRQIAHRVIRAEPSLRARLADPSSQFDSLTQHTLLSPILQRLPITSLLCGDHVSALTGGDQLAQRHRRTSHSTYQPWQQSSDSADVIRPDAPHGLGQHKGSAALPDARSKSAQPLPSYVTDALRSAQPWGERVLQHGTAPSGPRRSLVRLMASQADKAESKEGGGVQGQGAGGYGEEEKGGQTAGSGEEGKQRNEGEGLGGETGAEASGGEGAGGLKDAWKRVSVLLGGVSSAARSTGKRISELGPVTAASKLLRLVVEELSTPPAKRRAAQAAKAAASAPAADSSRVEVTVVQRKETWWQKRLKGVWEQEHIQWLLGRLTRVQSHPIVAKGQELADDIRDRWETSDSPVVHRIQDLNDSLFGETATAMAVKEIRKRDPDFSLPDFVHEVQEDVEPLLGAYNKGDMDALKAKCRREVVERCTAEKQALKMQGMTAHQKLLHVSDVEVREVKLVGSDPVIILSFQSQQILYVTDRSGKVTEGGKDAILTMYHLWAMQQASMEEAVENPNEPKWRLREMQQLGMQQLI